MSEWTYRGAGVKRACREIQQRVGDRQSLVVLTESLALVVDR